MDGFTRTMALTAVTDRETAEARRLFERARDTGVILNASFDDSVWKLTDEVHTCSIRFLPDEGAWDAGGGTWMGIGREAFMTYMKVFLVFSMGSLALISLRERASAVMDLASCSLKDLEERPFPLSALLFTELLPPSPERDTAAESLDDLSLPFRKGPGEPGTWPLSKPTSASGKALTPSGNRPGAVRRSASSPSGSGGT